MPRGLLLPPRNPLVFPAGRTPGIDPTHPAAKSLSKNYGYVATALKGWLVSSWDGQRSILASGTPTASTIGVLGPTINCSATNAVVFTPAGQNAVTVPSGITLAAILQFQTVSSGDHSVIGVGSTTILDFFSTFQLYNAGYVNSGITPVANVPYFAVASVDNGSGAVNFALVNLANGKIQTATGTSGVGSFLPIPPLEIGRTSQSPNAHIAAIAFCPTFLSMPQLRAWAADPWSFWYPPTILEIATRVGTPVTPVTAVSQGIPQGNLFRPGGRYGPTRGLTPTRAFPSVANQNYTLPIGAGSYTVTGATIGMGDALPIGAGTYVYTGANVTPGTGLNVLAGTYTYAGAAVTLGAGVNVPAGVYTYTGFSLGEDVELVVSPASYTYTGQGPTLGTDYVYRGFPVTLTYVPSSGATYTLAIAAGAYTYTGLATTLAVGMPVAAGSYAYTGAAITLGAGINVATGSYAVTGFPVTLSVGMGVGSGAYVYTGLPVGLGAGVNVGAGAYVYTGAAVRLDVGMGVGKGTYVYIGFDVQLIYTPIGPHNYVLSIGAGSYVYNGLAVGLVYVPAGGVVPSFGVGGKNVACNYGVSGQGTVFGFSNPVNPFATVVLETDR